MEVHRQLVEGEHADDGRDRREQHAELERDRHVRLPVEERLAADHDRIGDGVAPRSAASSRRSRRSVRRRASRTEAASGRGPSRGRGRGSGTASARPSACSRRRGPARRRGRDPSASRTRRATRTSLPAGAPGRAATSERSLRRRARGPCRAHVAFLAGCGFAAGSTPFTSAVATTGRKRTNSRNIVKKRPKLPIERRDRPRSSGSTCPTTTAGNRGAARSR